MEVALTLLATSRFDLPPFYYLRATQQTPVLEDSSSPEEIVEARAWINDLAYKDRKTIKQLAADAESRHAY